jgi:hypothetical protein
VIAPIQGWIHGRDAALTLFPGQRRLGFPLFTVRPNRILVSNDSQPDYDRS